MDTTHCTDRRRLLRASAAAVGLSAVLQEPIAPPALAEEAPKPGEIIKLTFPDLPRTLRAANSPDLPAAPTISVRLPDNYTKDKAFPLFVFLHGGQGSTGSEVDLPMQVVGKNDYVVATFPLFKKEINRDEQWGGVGIDFLDLSTLAGAYKAFLARINEAVPNLDPKTSVLGGYSNGGNALAMLLSVLDPTTLKHFSRFFFIDSGVDWTGYQRYKSLGEYDILFVVGKGGEDGDAWYRPPMLSRINYYSEVAKRYGVKRWQFVTVDGASHGDLDKFFPEVAKWASRK
jgi:hypothetical protein